MEKSWNSWNRTVYTWGVGEHFGLYLKRGEVIFLPALMPLQQALMLSRALDQQINIELCDLPH